jgi:hypothetical protein
MMPDVGGVNHYDAAAIVASKPVQQLARQAGTRLVPRNPGTWELLAAVSFILSFDCAFHA